MSNHVLSAYIAALQNLTALVKDKDVTDRLCIAADALIHCLRAGGKILIAGNGGSHCSALHFAEELTGRFRKDRPALGAIALGEATHASCVSNDYSSLDVFHRQVEGLGRKNDVLVVLSTSGNSNNLVNATETARFSGLRTIGLLGRGGGSLKTLVDIPVVFPGDTSDRIQELHMLALHVLVELVERELYAENYETA